VLIHFPYDVATGDRFNLDAVKSWWAKPCGTLPVLMKDGMVHILHQLDYGALNAPQAKPVILTADQLAAAKEAAAKKKADNAAKALAWNLQAAEAGDAYGEYRMGERYRDGDGVAKDLRQAANGSPRPPARVTNWPRKNSHHCPQTDPFTIPSTNPTPGLCLSPSLSRCFQPFLTVSYSIPR